MVFTKYAYFTSGILILIPNNYKVVILITVLRYLVINR
jgi:hypothetical protein